MVDAMELEHDRADPEWEAFLAMSVAHLLELDSERRNLD